MAHNDGGKVVVVTPQRTRFQAIYRGLCPRCRSGRIFAGMLRMNDSCPVCHLRFSRESGYFVGAMYVSYAVAVVLIGGFTALLSFWLLRTWSFETVVIAALILFVPLVPAVFRYSRIIWIHFDRYVDPEG